MFLPNTIKLFRYYKSLGDKSFDQLDEDHLFETPNEVSNSLAIMIKHLHGNMMSRWTDFLTADGEKEWRNRDGEFELEAESRADLMKLWEEGWNCLFHAIEPLTEEDLERIIYIRNEGHTVTEAIMRQLGHYSYHVGQIVYLARQLKGNDWHSLSIPKGGSQNYNKDKFSQDKQRSHFTDKV